MDSLLDKLFCTHCSERIKKEALSQSYFCKCIQVGLRELVDSENFPYYWQLEG